LAGANTRRIRKALAPLFGEKNLSKSAISRIVKRLKEEFDRWRNRDLSEESFAILYCDGFHLPVRVARRVVRVPVLAVIGVRHRDGKKILLSLSIARSESTASWSSVVEDLVRRGLPQPALVVLDGNAGLLRSIREGWPKTRIQRCTKHKLENLCSKAPKHSHAELKRDYDSIIHATDLSEAKRSHQAFVRKWRLLSNEVSRSLEEAGEDLLSFYSFPPRQWKCLRTTNPLEAVNSGFRRRTKTQGAFPNEDAALVLLYGLVAADQIHLKAIDGWKQLSEVRMPGLQQAA
jgi:putative transposase